MKRLPSAFLLLVLPLAAHGEEAVWHPRKGPDGMTRCYLASRRVRLPYKVLEAGAAPLQSLRLYVTRDGGKTWGAPVPVQASGASVPFDVPADGEYGFTLIAEDSVGNALPGPRAGEPPQLLVVVDTQAPAVLLEASGGKAMPAHVLPLTWRAQDAGGVDTVRVEASLDDGAHWKIIARGEAVGQAAWQVPENVPGELLLRAVARNLAGSRGASPVLRIPIAAAPEPAPVMPKPQPPSPPEPVPEPIPEPMAVPEPAPRPEPSVRPAPPRKQGTSQAMAHFKAAGIHRLGGRIEQAEAEYREAIAADPDFPSAHNDLGILLFRTDQARGLDELREAFRLAPEDADIAFNLGYALLRAGYPADAAKALRTAANERGEAVYYLALALTEDDRAPEGLAVLEKATGLEPEWASRCETLVRQLKTTIKQRPHP